MIKRNLLKIATCLLLCILTISATACNADINASNEFKDYITTNIHAKSFYYNEDLTFEINTVKLITDYETYSSYHLNLDYTEDFFAGNNLLVFITQSCSSDKLRFNGVREKDGALYPLFERKKIGPFEAVTEDVIITCNCAEISKELEYTAGEILYFYK